jgi:hypothetical protein
MVSKHQMGSICTFKRKEHMSHKFVKSKSGLWGKINYQCWITKIIVTSNIEFQY